MTYIVNTDEGLSYIYDNDGNAVKTCGYVDFGSGNYEYAEADCVDPTEVDRIWSEVADKYAERQANIVVSPELSVDEEGRIIL